ncbi:GvpL/GvpF family gas vesicle protein [Halobacillus sp. H74]|uniref:GvpL/GvpF family gas vesicle protein n=1 Tax=Halobacillus sp. H74 TaxID=3457436 RepID=UPI003FCD2CFB
MEELYYLYGVALKEEVQPALLSEMTGIDGEHELHVWEYGKCAAIVSVVEEAEYGEEVLEQKTQQMDWVQDKAFLHHEILMKLKDQATLVPMKFCTIFQHTSNLEAKIRPYESEWVKLLEELSGKEEWNVKIYNNPVLLKEEIAANHPSIQKKKEEIAQMSKGMQYLQQKKLDQLIDEQVTQEQQSFSKRLHDDWKDLCKDDVVKKVWNKSVTGKDEEMCWNSAYLIEKEKVEPFLEQVTAANEEGEAGGWKIEVTGPWPAYHFSSLSKSEV